MIAEAASTMQSAEQVTEANLASRALEQLRPEQRQVVLLSTCYGMSHEEISQATGMPLGTVKTHARRGLAAVREMLNRGGSIKGDEQPPFGRGVMQ